MRNYVLITYDITEPKRLRRVFKTLRGNGDGFQDSVFICQLSPKEETILKIKLDEMINHNEDQIVMIRLGGVDKKTISSPKEWTTLGKKVELSDNSVMVY